MSTKTDDAIAKLTADVGALTTIATSAVALLTGLSAQLTAAIASASAAGATTEQLDELAGLSNSIETATTALADAVTANTPAAEPIVHLAEQADQGVGASAAA